MELEIKEEQGMDIEIISRLPESIHQYPIPPVPAIIFQSPGFTGMMQEFKGRGFSAWHTHFWTRKMTILRARGDIPFLELRIGLENKLIGTWDKIEQPSLDPYEFNLSFTPFVETRAVFAADRHWSTFDIHFEASLLETIGLDYALLTRFLENVLKGNPAELTRYPHRCPVSMQDAIHFVLKNPMCWRQPRLLETKIHEILLIALETVASPEHPLPINLTPREIEGLHTVKEFIRTSIPDWPENAVLCMKGELNEFKLKTGFKMLFKQTIQEYHMELKFLNAKEILDTGKESISGVAYQIGYEHASSFATEFKKQFGETPKQYLKRKKIRY
jgi:AraC-like DNA-binding protein